MNRENNIYDNGDGSVLNATEFLEYVKSETKRQYEECSGEQFDDIATDEQQEMILDQYKWQIEARGWRVYNCGIDISSTYFKWNN